jgi:hypothetical protein
MICHFGQRDAGVTDSLDIRAAPAALFFVAGLHGITGQKIRIVTNGSIITIAPIALDRELCRYAK